MKVSTSWTSGTFLVGVMLVGMGHSQAATSVDTAAIAKTIKANVAALVAGINAHDVDKATAFDGPNLIFMECGSPATIGSKADRDGFRTHFAQDPSWRVSLIGESVDVARSGELAIYRGVYSEESRRTGVLMTHKTNFIAEFKRQSDGSWKMDWEVVSNMGKPHPKQ